MQKIVSLLVFCSYLEYANGYVTGETVLIFFNNYVPFNNLHDSTPYSSLISCDIKFRENYYSHLFGEELEGLHLLDSGMDVRFNIPSTQSLFCRDKLDSNQSQRIKAAIKHNARLEILVDDLRIWAPLGYFEEYTDSTFIYTHLQFNIFYNRGNIIKVQVQSSQYYDIDFTGYVNFMYSVEWIETDERFENRLENYVDLEFFQGKDISRIIWVNSAFVIFVCALVFFILRNLTKRDNENSANSGYSQWKLLENEIYSPPERMLLFIGGVSLGWHIAATIVTVTATMIITQAYKKPGYATNIIFFEYLLLSYICGLQCNASYLSYRSNKSLVSIFLIGPLFSVSVFLLLAGLKLIFSENISDFPLFTALYAIIYFLSIYLPLYTFGFLSGKLYYTWLFTSYPSVSPSSLKNPTTLSALSTTLLSLSGGLLPFLSIYPALYLFLVSFYTFRIYYSYPFLLLTTLLLSLSTICSSTATTFIGLNQGLHRWQWLSFRSSSSVGYYIFLYSLYYYLKSEMSGIVQLLYFLAYTGLGSVAIGLASGSLGYSSVSFFIRLIYPNIKSE